MRISARFTACAILIFSLMSSAVFAAGDVSVVSARGYNASNGTVNKILTSLKGVEFEIETDTPKAISLIVVKYAQNLCKEVIISDTVNVDGTKAEKLTVPTGSVSGIDTLKCIVVEADKDGLYPVINEVKVFTKSGWKVE